MEMKLMGIRFRVEIVIACLIIGAIIGGQVLCSCIHTETAKKVVKEGMEVKYTIIQINLVINLK